MYSQDSMTATQMAKEISWRLIWIGKIKSASAVKTSALIAAVRDKVRYEHKLWLELYELRSMVKLASYWPPCPSYN